MKKLNTPLNGVRLFSLGLCVAILFESTTPGFNPEWISIPAGEFYLGSKENASARKVAVSGFEMSRYEITVQQFVHYLNGSDASFDKNHACLNFERGRWVPRPGRRLYPITGIMAEQAQAYARWLGPGVRLPSADEWEVAARGGVDGAPFAWGWGAPMGRARFASTQVGPVGQFTPNGYGLYDMAGNVFELALEEGRWVLLGGSWAERSEATLKLYKRFPIAETYADRDAGFRVLRDL